MAPSRSKRISPMTRDRLQRDVSSVIKPPTISLVLGVVVSKDWCIRQIDINNAFLQGRLEKDVYMIQSSRFVDKDRPDYVCKLKKALYGLKKAPRAWYLELHNFFASVRFS